MYHETIFCLLVLFSGCCAQEDDNGSGIREDEIENWGNHYDKLLVIIHHVYLIMNNSI